MALKPTIYKARLAISNLNTDYYNSHNLTLALHPSETIERMHARLLAFCLNAQQTPVFTKGLSTIEEPDLWVKALNDDISLWIDVGEPAPERIKKACRQAVQVKIYSFNSKSDTWWQQNRAKLTALAAEYLQFPWPEIEALAELTERTMDFSVTISGNSLYVASAKGDTEVSWTSLNSST